MAETRYGGLTCEEASDLAAGFVLDALDLDEAGAVRTHLAACPNAHPAFEEVASAVPALLEAVPIVEPPAHLGKRIREAAAREAKSAPVAGPIGGESSSHARTAGRAGTGRARWSFAFGLAAAVAIAALGAWNLTLRQDLEAADRYASAVTATLDLAVRSGSVAAVLAPSTPGGPAGLAAVASDGTVSIAVRGLAATSGREVYEAWAIQGGGPPVPIGGFTVSTDGYGALKSRTLATGPGLVIALTREPEADPTTPTLPILVSGPALDRPS